jgi:hypothetical protein
LYTSTTDEGEEEPVQPPLNATISPIDDDPTRRKSSQMV